MGNMLRSKRAKREKRRLDKDLALEGGFRTGTRRRQSHSQFDQLRIPPAGSAFAEVFKSGIALRGES